MSMRGRLCFVGGGPGDPGLITLRGMEALEKASLVLAPGHFARTYSRELDGKVSLDPFDYEHEELFAKIESFLARGEDAVFLVPGDLATFSPVQSIIDRFRVDADVVPGVSTMNAAAAILKHTFDLPGVSHSTIITSPKTITGSPDTIGELSRHQATLVLFMNNKPVEELVAELTEGYAPDTPVAVVYMASMPEQEVVVSTLAGLADDVDRERFDDEDIHKLIIVGGVLTATEDPSWWDRRKQLRDQRHAARAQKRGGRG